VRTIISLIAITFLTAGKMVAQDVIFLKTGEEILSFVEEINPDNVKYIRHDNPNGPLYTLYKSDIFMIKYENGTKDVFYKEVTIEEIRRRLVEELEELFIEEIWWQELEDEWIDQEEDALIDKPDFELGDGISFGLGGRKLRDSVPQPNSDTCQVTSRIVVTVEIQVDRPGNVTSATIQNATYGDNCIWNAVLEAARRTTFTEDPNATFKQKGWIRYTIEP